MKYNVENTYSLVDMYLIDPLLHNENKGFVSFNEITGQLTFKLNGKYYYNEDVYIKLLTEVIPNIKVNNFAHQELIKAIKAKAKEHGIVV